MLNLHHLALGARDVRLVANFYGAAFGLSTLREHLQPDGSLRSIWLELNSAVLMIEQTREAQRRVEDVGAGPFLLTFSVKRSEREQVEFRLADLGAPIERRTEWTSYARDPEGNRVAVSCYPF